MIPFEIVSDGSCDLTKEQAAELNIKIVPFYVSLDGINYQKEIEELSLDTFYDKMLGENIYPRTSLPSVHIGKGQQRNMLYNNKYTKRLCPVRHYRQGYFGGSLPQLQNIYRKFLFGYGCSCAYAYGGLPYARQRNGYRHRI